MQKGGSSTSSRPTFLQGHAFQGGSTSTTTTTTFSPSLQQHVRSQQQQEEEEELRRYPIAISTNLTNQEEEEGM